MVYVFLAQGFEEVEALAPVDLMRRAGLEVSLVGVGGKMITGSHGISVEADLTEKEIVTRDLQAMVLPGGLPGTLNLEACPEVDRLLDYCVQHDILIAAICAAPSILAHKGLLKGKNAAVFPSFQQDVTEGGGNLSGSYVVTDGKILTARGMGVAVQFGLKLTELLVSPEKAAQLKASIQWEN